MEEGVLGRVEPEARESFGEYSEKKDKGLLEYYTFEQAISNVKENQPFKNPSLPREKIFPLCLIDTANRSLKLKKGSGQLEFCTFVGSRLDNIGMDAMVELLTDKGKRLRVALDITSEKERLWEKLNQRKEGLYKEIKEGHETLLIPYIPFLWPKDGLDFKNEKDEILFDQIVKEVSDQVINGFNIEAEKRGLIIISLSSEEVESVKKSEEERKKVFSRLPRSRQLRRRLVYAK